MPFGVPPNNFQVPLLLTTFRILASSPRNQFLFSPFFGRVLTAYLGKIYQIILGVHSYWLFQRTLINNRIVCKEIIVQGVSPTFKARCLWLGTTIDYRHGLNPHSRYYGGWSSIEITLVPHGASPLAITGVDSSPCLLEKVRTHKNLSWLDCPETGCGSLRNERWGKIQVLDN